MLKFICAITSLFVLNNIHSQGLHPLEEIDHHYKRLHQLDASPNSERGHLDTIKYPMDKAFGQQFIGIEPAYLTSNQVEQLKQWQPFPANSSEQTQAELKYLLEWENKRTEEDVDRAMEIAHIGYWPPLEKGGAAYNTQDLFWECKSINGYECRFEKYPATLKLLAGVTRDMRIMEFTVKYHLLRPRPYHLNPEMNPMARISSPSYASGHTLWAYIQAFTWSELIPEKRTAFLDLAYEVGESREIMGIHYPSDEEAARVLAHKMLEYMWGNELFLMDLKNAKAEWE